MQNSGITKRRKRGQGGRWGGRGVVVKVGKRQSECNQLKVPSETKKRKLFELSPSTESICRKKAPPNAGSFVRDLTGSGGRKQMSMSVCISVCVFSMLSMSWSGPFSFKRKLIESFCFTLRLAFCVLLRLIIVKHKL